MARGHYAAYGSLFLLAWLLIPSCSSFNPPADTLQLSTIVPLSYVPVQSSVSPVTGAPYAAQLSAEGGLPPYRWSLSGGALPSGLTLSPSGIITGTSSETGKYTYSVVVEDSKGAVAGGEISGTMNPSGTIPFDIAVPVLPTYGQNEDLGYEPFVEGGTPPYTFAVTGLPSGVSYDPTTGTLSGDPPAAGSYTLTVVLKDSNGNVANGTPATVTLEVAAPQSVSGSSSGGSSGGNSGVCDFPVAQLSISVSSQACSACTRLAIFAESPQIAAAIAAGKSPCTETDSIAGGPQGCLMETVYAQTYAACGGTSCGPYSVDLSQEFLPVSAGAASAINDTVSFCPFNYDGTSLTAAGTCVSSLTNQCDSSATITVIINGA